MLFPALVTPDIEGGIANRALGEGICFPKRDSLPVI
jgi:hypothetical protein